MSPLAIAPILSDGVIALLVVLAVLLVGAVIYRKLTDRSGSAAKGCQSGEAPAVPAEPMTDAPAPATPAAATPAPAGHDDAVIAAITAAVAATLAAENGGQVPAFRVVSFRKVATVSQRK